MNRNMLFAVLLASTVSLAASWAQTAPTLPDACARYAAAMERVRDPHVPFPVVAGAVARTRDAAKACEAKKGDPAAIQDAANEVAVAAAPYQGAKP
jgi:hypothetical protein